jgi:hypothetical protein
MNKLLTVTAATLIFGLFATEVNANFYCGYASYGSTYSYPVESAPVSAPVYYDTGYYGATYPYYYGGGGYYPRYGYGVRRAAYWGGSAWRGSAWRGGYYRPHVNHYRAAGWGGGYRGGAVYRGGAAGWRGGGVGVGRVGRYR